MSGARNDDDPKEGAMQTKTLMVEMKADEAAETGRFTGYASVFGNVDSYGDVVKAGAFEESLKSFGEGGALIPCYWSHQMDDPMKCIGWTTSAVEDDHGLKVNVQLDLDNPNGAQAHKLMKAGVVRQMSFAFEVLDGGPAKSEELGEHFELRKLSLFEVSVVQVGANQATELLDVKDRLARVKAGRKISADNEDKLRQASGLIEDVLSTIDAAEEGSDEEQPEGNDEEQETAKSEDLKGAKSRTLTEVDIAEMELRLMEVA